MESIHMGFILIGEKNKVDLNELKDLQKWLELKCNISYDLETLLNVNVLKLNNKGLSELHPDISKLKRLKRLYCSNNLLNNINIKSSSLEILYCCNNNISNLQVKSPKLLILYCSHNKISELIIKSKKINFLDCSHNNIRTIFIKNKKLLYFKSIGNTFRLDNDDPHLELFKLFNQNNFEIIDSCGISELL